MIGYANFNIQAFKKWNDNYTSVRNDMAHEGWVSDHWPDYFYERQGLFKDCLNIMDEHIFKSSSVEDLKALITHLEDIGEKLQLFYFDDTACIVGYENDHYILPAQFVTPKYLKDYSRLTALEMNRLTGETAANTLLPAQLGLDDVSVESLSDKKKIAEKQLEDAKAELKAKEEAIREEMYKKIEAMKAEMAGKLDELNNKIEQCQKEIFVLESQIFSIRCYTGEVVKFHQIRSGKPATPETPLVLYQKIRFLDEELGKHISIFDFDGEDDKRLIPLLKARNDIAELLAPKGRSLTVLRTSRTGKFVAANEDVANCLKEYDMYHGMQLALLLRDGENLYIAWCDADRIQIDEDNAFYSTSTKVKAADEGSRTTDISEALSRFYLLVILQGMVDSGNILHFPEHVNVMSSPYVIFSYAEGWVEVDKYGTFADMLKKSKDIAPKKGDRIVTVTRLRSETSGRSYDNDRGIGCANRTRDVYISGKEVYPVNVVYYDAVVEYEYEALRVNETMGTKDVYWTKDGVTTIKQEPDVKFEVTDEVMFTEKESYAIDFEVYRKLKDEDIMSQAISDKSAVGNKFGFPQMYYTNGDTKYIYSKPDGFYRKVQLSEKDLYVKRITSAKVIKKMPHIFVSVEQHGYGSYQNGWKDTKYHVNFEIMPYEYISTAFLCSSWVDEVIRSGKTGHVRFAGAEISFADLLPYLHILKEEIKKREVKEKELLMNTGGQEFVDTHEDWNAYLCEWKIMHEVHELTPTRAKRFLRSLKG